MLLSSGQNKKKQKTKNKKSSANWGRGGGSNRFIILYIIMKYIKIPYNLPFILILMDLFRVNGQFYIIEKKNSLKSIY
jgi:hypothetical protein